MNFVNSSGGNVTANFGTHSMGIANASVISLDNGLTFQSDGAFLACIFGLDSYTVTTLAGSVAVTGGTNSRGLYAFDSLSITNGLTGNVAVTGSTNAYGLMASNGTLSIAGGLSGNVAANTPPAARRRGFTASLSPSPTECPAPSRATAMAVALAFMASLLSALPADCPATSRDSLRTWRADSRATAPVSPAAFPARLQQRRPVDIRIGCLWNHRRLCQRRGREHAAGRHWNRKGLGQWV